MNSATLSVCFNNNRPIFSRTKPVICSGFDDVFSNVFLENILSNWINNYPKIGGAYVLKTQNIRSECWRRDKFFQEDEVIIFKEPIDVVIKQNDDVYEASFEPLKINVFDDSLGSVMDYFTDVLFYYFDVYACADDSELTKDALLYKKWFSDNMIK